MVTFVVSNHVDNRNMKNTRPKKKTVTTCMASLKKGCVLDVQQVRTDDFGEYIKEAIFVNLKSTKSALSIIFTSRWYIVIFNTPRIVLWNSLSLLYRPLFHNY